MPDVDTAFLRRLLHGMVRARRFDEKLLQLQRQGDIGTFAPCKGQEASQVGSAACLKDADWVVPSFRETATLLWRGASMSGMLLYNAGYNEGGHIPDERNDFPIAIPVASQLPHAVGIAYAAQFLGDQIVVMAYFGDGATSEGDFHEAMNFAAVFQLPVVFVCQNNHWAISHPRERQTRSNTLAQKALAYGMPGMQVDGNDVLAVFEACRCAVERAREGNGPTMVECVTYRMEVHTTADDPDKYRDPQEVEEWKARDPIKRLRTYLEKQQELSEKDMETMTQEIDREIRDAWNSATDRIGELQNDPQAMFDHLYDQLPPHLQAQRLEFERYLEHREPEQRED